MFVKQTAAASQIETDGILLVTEGIQETTYILGDVLSILRISCQRFGLADVALIYELLPIVVML